MRQKRESKLESAGRRVQDIRRATRRNYSAEEKIRILLEGYSVKTNPIVGPWVSVQILFFNRRVRKVRGQESVVAIVNKRVTA